MIRAAGCVAAFIEMSDGTSLGIVGIVSIVDIAHKTILEKAIVLCAGERPQRILGLIGALAACC